MTKGLIKIKANKKKRVGRGYGSGKGGHTVGRGVKGQKSRSKIGILFEGVKVKKSLLKRLPLRRGKGKFSTRPKPVILDISLLELLPSGSKVNVDTLVKHGLVDKKDANKFGVKILGNTKIKKKFTVLVPMSKSALKIIEKAGGSILMQDKDKSKTPTKNK